MTNGCLIITMLTKILRKVTKCIVANFILNLLLLKNIFHQYYHLKPCPIVMYSWSHDVIHPKGIIGLNHFFHLEQINICSCLRLFNNYEIMIFINHSTIEDINISKFLKLTTTAYEMLGLFILPCVHLF